MYLLFQSKQTVLGGTVTRPSETDSGSRQLQRIAQSLMTMDELKSTPKDYPFVMKRGLFKRVFSENKVATIKIPVKMFRVKTVQKIPKI